MNWPLFIIGAIAGGFINGLAGFGTALFALGFWLQFLDPVQAVGLVLVVSAVTGLQGLWVVRRAIMDKPRRLMRFLLPALVGIPLGVALLAQLDAAHLKLTIASMLILYGGYFSLRRNLPKFDRPTPIMDSLIGFLGGILGGAAALSGALPTMWCAMRPWPKAETRAVLQPFNVVVLGLTCIVFALRGVYTAQSLTLLAVALPVSLVAAQLGIHVYQRISDHAFRRLLVVMTFASGAVMLIRELF